jgi:hypothetical protein
MAIVAILLFSGCFNLRAFKWSARKIDAGGRKVVAVLGLYPDGDSGEARETDNPFVIVIFPDDPNEDGGQINWSVVTPRSFDVKGNFGGPRTLYPNSAVEHAIHLYDVCPDVPVAPYRVMLLLVEGTPVESNDNFRKQALTKIGVKAGSSAGSTEDRVSFVSGGWDDDGDDVAEEEELYCTGAIATTLPVR